MRPEQTMSAEPQEAVAPLQELGQSLLLIGMLVGTVGAVLGLAVFMVRIVAG